MEMKSRVDILDPSKHIKLMSRGNKHIIVNVKCGTWVAIDGALWHVLSGLSSWHSLALDKRFVLPMRLLASRRLMSKDMIAHVPQPYRSEIFDVMKSSCASDCSRLHTRKSILFNVTGACNLKCVYCCVDSHMKTDELSLPQINEVARKLQSAHVVDVTISGGEPFVRPDLIDIIAHFSKFVQSLSLNTNGTLITRKIAHQLARFQPKIVVSLDGSMASVNDTLRGAGTFERAMASIRLLKTAGLKDIKIRTVICKHNMQDIPNIMALARDIGISFSYNSLMECDALINDLALRPSNEDMEILDEKLWRAASTLGFPQYPKDRFFRRLVERARARCQAGWPLIQILPDGSVFPCFGLVRPDYYIGNVLDNESFENLLKRSHVLACLQLRHVDRMAKCISCDVRYFCGGGCIAHPFDREGCEWTQRVIRRRLWGFDINTTLEQNIRSMFGPSSKET